MNSRFAGLARIPFFLPLAGATLLLGVALSFTAPYLSLFSIERAGMSPFQLGLFMTLIAASGVAASSWAGKWSDRHGHHRALLLAALSAAALGYICLCFVKSYLALLFIAIAFLGAGGSALSLVFSFGRSALPVRNEAERAFATAALRTVLSVSWVFGPAIGALILAAIGFYGLFLFAAGSFIACAAIVLKMSNPGESTRMAARAAMQEKREHDSAASETAACDVRMTTESASSHVQEAGSSSRVASSSALWRAVLALTLLGLVANATMIVLPLYIVRGLGGTQIDVSIMLGLGALLEIPMMLALGAKGARLNKLRWLAVSAAVHAVYFLLVTLAWNLPILIPMQALAAFVVAVTSCLGMTYVQDLMPGSPGAATALFFNAARVGSIASGILSGVLVGVVGYRGTFLCCAVLAGTALWLFADPQRDWLLRCRQSCRRYLRRFTRP